MQCKIRHACKSKLDSLSESGFVDKGGESGGGGGGETTGGRLRRLVARALKGLESGKDMANARAHFKAPYRILYMLNGGMQIYNPGST